MSFEDMIKKDTLRSLRIKFGYTQDEAAGLLAVSTHTLRAWEQNSDNLPYQKIKRIEEVYRTSQDNIFFGSESAFSEILRGGAEETVQ